MYKKFLLIIIAISILFFSCKSQKLEEEFILAPQNFDEFLITYGDILELDSFEYGYKWQTLFESELQEDFDLSKNCNISNDWSSEGNYSLKCDFRSSSNIKETTATFVFEKNINTFWKNAKFIVLVAHNPNMDCIRIGTRIDDFSSEAYICPPGDHLLLIDITDYANTLQNEIDTNTVKNLCITVNEIDKLTSGSDKFYFDNLRLIMDNSNQIQTSADKKDEENQD